MVTARLHAMTAGGPAMTVRLHAMTAGVPAMTVRLHAMTACVSAMTVGLHAVTAGVSAITVGLHAVTACVSAITVGLHAVTACVPAMTVGLHAMTACVPAMTVGRPGALLGRGVVSGGGLAAAAGASRSRWPIFAGRVRVAFQSPEELLGVRVVQNALGAQLVREKAKGAAVGEPLGFQEGGAQRRDAGTLRRGGVERREEIAGVHLKGLENRVDVLDGEDDPAGQEVSVVALLPA